ncbi:cytochrome P450 [Fomitopsis serialis]|uniref:cytochrome P450 n=1 Tax=Fomitopsis serialis TaxID=139415 RepID=UPI0020076382|nr:cytochrome P450 [Neoantrodia serialis]KAH9937078.1 cytochrome P450 [Neoantrodia serialis]
MPDSRCIALLLGLLLSAALTRFLPRVDPPPAPPTGSKYVLFGSGPCQSVSVEVYAEWRKTYGDVIYIRVSGTPSSSAIYSSRPYRPMYGLGLAISTIPYGPWWKQHRTLFTNTSAPTPHPTTTPSSQRDMRDAPELLTTPDNLSYHVRRLFFHPAVPAKSLTPHSTAAAIIMQIIYGHQVAPEGDVFVVLADRALETLGHAGIFGTYLVDYIPLLRHVPTWMPGAAFKRKALEWRKLNRAMLNEPYEMVKERTVSPAACSGTAVPCFATAEVEKRTQSGQDPQYERLVKGVAAPHTPLAQTRATTPSSSDTDNPAISPTLAPDVSAIQSFFLAATVYPDMFKRCQAEIDRVVGPARLPTFADRHLLPYVDWVVWECLRWNPGARSPQLAGVSSAPLGVAHSVTEDDVYEGHWIPKGTTVLPNTGKLPSLTPPLSPWLKTAVRAKGHPARRDDVPRPAPVRPERYADKKTNAERGTNEPPLAAFGFGRRICPGRWLAMDNIWVAVATVAAVFDVSKTLDAHGVPVEPSVEFSSTMLSRPPPFPCRITPRSEAARRLIEQSVYAD